MANDTIPLEEALRRVRDAQQPRPMPENPGYITPPLSGVVDPLSLAGKDVPRRRWIVDGWIPHGAVTMISGDGATGKSTLTMQLLACCATGQEFLGMKTARCRALGIFCEDDADELHRRQARINDSYGLTFEDLENVQWASLVGCDNALTWFNKDVWSWEPTQLYQQIHNAASNFGAQVLVIDSLHDVFSGNENARPEVRKFVQYLHALAIDIDGAVVLNAHPSQAGRNSGTGESGSTAWNNSVRSRLYLTRPKANDYAEPDRTERLLSKQKSNYSADNDDAALKLQMVNGVFTRTDRPAGKIGAIERDNVERVFLDLLDRSTREGRRVSHKQRASNYAPKMFARRGDRDGFDKRDFEGAMERLFQYGTIIVGSVKDESRRHVDAIVRA